MTDWLRDMIENRQEIFKKRGREFPDWRSLKKKIKSIVKGRKKKYHDFVLDKFKQDTNPANFYRHVNC